MKTPDTYRPPPMPAKRQPPPASANITFVCSVKPEFKRAVVRAAAARKQKLERWLMDAAEAFLAPRCFRCGCEEVAVHEVTGRTSYVCLVCQLRGDLEAERARVARLEAEREIGASV